MSMFGSIMFWLRKVEPPLVAPPVVPPVAKPRAAPKRREPRRVIATHILCHKFVRWMQASGATGYWLVDEIDELRESFCDLFGFEVPHAYEFRSFLANTKGCTRGIYRLKSWEFLEVAKRTTMERPTLYKIHDKVVEATFTSTFYAELETPRQGVDDCRMVSHPDRMVSGKDVEKKRRRPYPKRKAVLKPTVSCDDVYEKPYGNREIERKAA